MWCRLYGGKILALCWDNRYFPIFFSLMLAKSLFYAGMKQGPMLTFKAAPHGGLWSHEPWSGKFKCLLWLSWSMKATVNIWISRFMVHETKAHRVVPPWKSVMTANWLQPWWQAIWHATIIWFKAFFSQESLRHNFCFKILSKKLPQEAQHQNLAWNYKP